MTAGGGPQPVKGKAALAQIPGAPTAWTRLRKLLILAAVIAIWLWSAIGTDFNPGRVITGIPEMWDLFLRMLPTERAWDGDVARYTFSWETLRAQFGFISYTWAPLTETLRIAVMSATIGALLSVPFSLMGARNMVRFKWLYWSVRSVLNLIRTIPDLVLAAVFSGAFGVGALPGILAMSVFSFTIMAKLLSESIEAIDPGPVEALRACGANRLQLIMFAVVPQVLPQYIAYSLYVFEINVRASAVLGVVGAGGIGHVLKAHMSYFDYPSVAVIILVILLVVVATDYVSNKLRERLV